MLKFYIIKNETMERGYENIPSTCFITWDKNGNPIRENMDKACRYFTKDGIKKAIKKRKPKGQKWKPHLLIMSSYEIEL